MLTKGCFKGYDRSAVNDVRVTSCSAIFFTLKRICETSNHANSFEVRGKCLRQKRCKISRAIKLLTQIFKFLEILPPKLKNSKFWILSSLNSKFSTFSKTGTNVIEPIVDYWHAKFQLDSSFRGVVMTKKIFQSDDVQYSKLIFLLF